MKVTVKVAMDNAMRRPVVKAMDLAVSEISCFAMSEAVNRVVNEIAYHGIYMVVQRAVSKNK